MHRSTLTSLVLASIGLATAQDTRPTNTSICDWYTTALLKTNNATNQYALVSLVVNTAVIGNYTKPNVGISVPGILAKGTYNGTAVNLAQYFDGSLLSSNRGGSSGVSINFLDGGGAAPVEAGTVATSKTSNQYFLLTHLYEYFGALLGCTEYGMTGYPAYAGHTSMYEVHKFMGLDASEVGYFIEQVGLAAASFGVAKADVTAVGMALESLFGYRCAPPTAILPKETAELQSICIDSDCPEAANATCSSYAAVVDPKNATTASNSTGTSTGTGTSNGTGTGTGTTTTTGVAMSTGGAAGLIAQGSVVGLMSLVTVFFGMLSL